MPFLTGTLPRYAGIVTFARAPYADVDALRPGMAAVAGVTFDLSSSGEPGSRYGPREIRISSIRLASLATMDGAQILDGDRVAFSRAGKTLVGKLVDLGDFNEFSTDWDRTASVISQSMYEVARRGALPIIFGGDQLNSASLIAGFTAAMAEKGKRVGYIRLSSQLDLGAADPLWGEVWRGTTTRRILESGAISHRNMVWLGTNGYLPKDQVTFAKDRQLRIFTLAQMRERGIEAALKQALKFAGERCDTIYASIDHDVLDGVHIQSMNVPVFDGLTNYEMDHIIDLLAAANVGALDITGCNPMLEYRAQGRLASQQTAWWAFRFIMRSPAIDF